jgi:hypothetical protein
MKLVNPGAGETSDRLTILALKILAGLEQGKETVHWETEQAALLTQIRARTLNGKWFEAVLKLGAVNAMLWHAEDDLRALGRQWEVWNKPDSSGLTGAEDRKRAALEAAPLAFRIQALNDRRAELVQQINKEAGDGDTKEKG